jgi:hypothetical protein
MDVVDAREASVMYDAWLGAMAHEARDVFGRAYLDVSIKADNCIAVCSSTYLE